MAKSGSKWSLFGHQYVFFLSLTQGGAPNQGQKLTPEEWERAYSPYSQLGYNALKHFSFDGHEYNVETAGEIVERDFGEIMRNMAINLPQLFNMNNNHSNNNQNSNKRKKKAYRKP